MAGIAARIGAASGRRGDARIRLRARRRWRAREEFREGALPGMRELVPCLMVTYNEVDFPPDDDHGRGSAGAVIEGGTETFVRLGHQNPLIPRYQRTRDGRPYKWSDLVTRRELHRTDLYLEAYGPMGVEYQMAFCLPAPPELIIGIALSRDRPDFSERDRAVLNLIRGPMIQAYRTVQRYTAVVERLRAAERGLERGGVGVVVLARRRGSTAARVRQPRGGARARDGGRRGRRAATGVCSCGSMAARGPGGPERAPISVTSEATARRWPSSSCRRAPRMARTPC